MGRREGWGSGCIFTDAHDKVNTGAHLMSVKKPMGLKKFTRIRVSWKWTNEKGFDVKGVAVGGPVAQAVLHFHCAQKRRAIATRAAIMMIPRARV